MEKARRPEWLRRDGVFATLDCWMKARGRGDATALVAQLAMGHRSNVSHAVSAFADPSDAQRKNLQRILHIYTD